MTYDVDHHICLPCLLLEELLVLHSAYNGAHTKLLGEHVRFGLIANERCSLVARVAHKELEYCAANVAWARSLTD